MEADCQLWMAAKRTAEENRAEKRENDEDRRTTDDESGQGHDEAAVYQSELT
jgi:hypothetical protein